MWHKEIIPDKTINQKVTQQLAARGMRAPCSIAVQTAKGVVTLSGNIEYEHQRNAAMQAARHLDGVSRVVDQLHVKAKTSPWKLEPARPSPAPIAPSVPRLPKGDATPNVTPSVAKDVAGGSSSSRQPHRGTDVRHAFLPVTVVRRGCPSRPATFGFGDCPSYRVNENR